MGAREAVVGSLGPSLPGTALLLPSAPLLGREGMVGTVARTPQDGLCCCQQWPHRPRQEHPATRGRHADSEAGGCQALRPPGEPRSGLPGTLLQVSAHHAGAWPVWFLGVIGFGLASPNCHYFIKGTLVSHPPLADPCVFPPTCTVVPSSPPVVRAGQGHVQVTPARSLCAQVACPHRN